MPVCGMAVNVSPPSWETERVSDVATQTTSGRVGTTSRLVKLPSALRVNVAPPSVLL